jgi:hypothetical protein
MKTCIECGSALSGKQAEFCCGACKQRNHYHRVKHQQDTYHSQTRRGLRRKLKLIAMLGGRCRRCGYRRNLAALEFHHRQAGERRFPLDLRSLSTRRRSTITGEAARCDLPCANCHAELHHPELDFSSTEARFLDP